MWWPGWDSIESADWWAHVWFWLGIGCLFALGAAEVISHLYGLRKDELISLREQAAEDQRKQQEEAHKASVSNLEKQLTDAEKQIKGSSKKVAELEKFQKQRRLTNDQKKAIIKAISPFRGQRMTISSIIGNGETKIYRDDFVEVFDAAGWDHRGDNGIFEANYNIDPTGIQIAVHQANERQGQSNDAINALIKIIKDLNLFDSGSPIMNQQVAAGEVNFIVGQKPHL